MKIVDCFIFYNELDLLNYRLHILNDIVDYFVIVESTHTFSGKEKELYYEKNKEMFSKFGDKIIHIIVDDFKYKYPDIDYSLREQWKNEEYQRNCIARGIEKLDLANEDIIMITDMDEIIDPDHLLDVKLNGLVEDILKLEMDFYYYNLQTKQKDSWYYGRIMTYKKYKDLGLSCELIRKYKDCKTIKRFGWHLSYFGNSEFIRRKIDSFSHQDLNKEEYTNIENIESSIKSCKELYGKDTNIEYIQLEHNYYLPKDYEKYLQKYILQEPPTGESNV